MPDARELQLLTYGKDVPEPQDPVRAAIEVFRTHPQYASTQGKIMDGIDRVNTEKNPANMRFGSPERLSYVLEILDVQIGPTLHYITNSAYHDAFENLIWGLAERAWEGLVGSPQIRPMPGNESMHAIEMHVRKWSREGLRRLEQLQGQVPATLSLENRTQQPDRSPEQIEVVIQQRKAILSEYKAAAGNPSNRRIYRAKNSGIHKPEFYEWVNGILPDDSSTSQNFERFLKEGKPPIPRTKG